MKNHELDMMIKSHYRTTFFDGNTPFFVYQDSITNYILSTGNKIQDKRTLQYVKDLGDKRYFQYFDKIMEDDYTKNSTISTNFNYDFENGNIIEQIKKYGKKNSTTTIYFTETNKYKYEKYGGWGPKNRLVSDTTITKHADFDTPFTRSTSYQYDNKGNLKKIITDTGVTTSFEINNLGLVYQKTVSASGESTYTETIGYDEKYRFAESLTIPD
jgi:hypothetical protein